MKIPAGTFITISAGLINTDPRTWGPDADIFNPDRWDNLPEQVTNYSFMTFLQGRLNFMELTTGSHSCIGRRFAETEIKVIVAALVGKFIFEELVPGRPVEQVTMLTTRPKGGLHLRIRKVQT